MFRAGGVGCRGTGFKPVFSIYLSAGFEFRGVPVNLPDMLNPIPPRRYLAEEVESVLLAAIREGRFGEFLPGERRLAQMIGVSRPTLRLALGVLVKRGDLRVERGRRTRIVAASTAPAEVKTGRVVVLSQQSLHGLTPGMLFAVDLLREQLEGRHIHLELRMCAAFRQAAPERALAKMVESEPADVWLLHQAPKAVQRWFSENKRPAIIIGTPADGVALPGVDTDFRPAARHAFAQLVKAGHEPGRIALVLPDIDLPGHRAMATGFTDAGGAPAAVLRHPADAEAIPEWVDRRFARIARPPTAVIVAWPLTTLSLLTRLGFGHGWTIPGRLSAICLSDDRVLEMISPPVNRYNRDARRYVSLLTRLVLRSMRGLAEAGETRNLMPEYVKGGSVAPPASADAGV